MKFKGLIKPLIVFFIVLNLGFLIVLLYRYGAKTSGTINITPTVSPSLVSPSATPVKQALEVNLGQRKPGTVEEITLIAEPKTPNDSVAMVRIYVTNGVVLNFIADKYLVLGTCADNKKFTNNRVCVDIAKSTPFVQGDVLGVITVNWGDNGKIYREPGDGYYNGSETNYNVPVSVSEAEDLIHEALLPTLVTQGKVAGASAEKSFNNLAGLMLVVSGFIFLILSVSGIYYVLVSTRSNLGLTVKRYVVISSIIMLSGLIYSATAIANRSINKGVDPANKIALSANSNIKGVNSQNNSGYTTIIQSDNTILTEPVDCGPIDINNDRLLNYVDYQAMQAVYNKTCNNVSNSGSCGSRDVNQDNRVDFKDWHYFSARYFPKSVDCSN